MTTNIESCIRSLPIFTPPEKLDNLLQLLADLSPGIGRYTTFNGDRDWPLLISTVEEIQFLTVELMHRGYVSGTNNGLLVTMTGWERLAEIRAKGQASSRAFVAMWFDSSRDPIYVEAIEPAIREAGYDALRIDKAQFVNRIDDEIIGQIRRARFMVADFTGQRAGVYFEAGMMLGLGRNVIWMCGKSDLEKVHFDTRQYNFIVYETPPEAKKLLYNRILAIEGEGTHPQSKAAISGI